VLRAAPRRDAALDTLCCAPHRVATRPWTSKPQRSLRLSSILTLDVLRAAPRRDAALDI